MAVHRVSTPSPEDAVVSTTGTRHSPMVGLRSSMFSRSRRVSGAPSRSALLTTKMSAISSRPALLAWMASPQRGVTTTTVVSAAPAISTSTWPTPTVSTRTVRVPAAASTRIAAGAATASPPWWPRVAIDRMNTPWSRACPCMRMRSPRMAPPEKGEEGSTASTPTRPPPARTPVMTRAVRVDFPAPGASGDADDVPRRWHSGRR